MKPKYLTVKKTETTKKTSGNPPGPPWTGSTGRRRAHHGEGDGSGFGPGAEHNTRIK